MTYNFFRAACSNNNHSVLHQSPLSSDVLRGVAPDCPYEVNEVSYKLGYYLDDEIYLNCLTIVISFPHPIDDKYKVQENIGKQQ